MLIHEHRVRYGLSNVEIALMQQLMAQLPRIEAVILFGSRAQGNYGEGSDVDFAIQGKNLDYSVAAMLQQNLEDLGLLLRYDVVLINDELYAPLRDHIQRVGTVFYDRAEYQNELVV